MSEHVCLQCNTDISGKRIDARFCGARCKKQWQRAQVKKPEPPKPVPKISSADEELLKRLNAPQYRKGNRL